MKIQEMSFHSILNDAWRLVGLSIISVTAFTVLFSPHLSSSVGSVGKLLGPLRDPLSKLPRIQNVDNAIAAAEKFTFSTLLYLLIFSFIIIFLFDRFIRTLGATISQHLWDLLDKRLSKQDISGPLYERLRRMGKVTGCDATFGEELLLMEAEIDRLQNVPFYRSRYIQFTEDAAFYRSLSDYASIFTILGFVSFITYPLGWTSAVIPIMMTILSVILFIITRLGFTHEVQRGVALP